MDRCPWAGAVCINQDDVADKSHKAGMMGNIYKSTHQVISELVQEDDSSARAMASLPRINMSTDRFDVIPICPRP